MGKVIFGGIIGGIIAFVWSFVSWAVLPWHEWTFQSFKNEEFVSWVIQENVKKDGIYMIPYLHDDKVATSPSELKSKFDEEKPTKDNGPFVYAQIKQKGIDYPNPRYFIYSFLTQFIGAALICYLLSKVTESGYGGRLVFVTLMGLVVGVLGHIPNWIWFGGSNLFLLIMIADLLITWFLAGLILAAMIKPRREHELMM